MGSPDCESVTRETATTWTSGQPSGRQFLSEILSVHEFTLSSRTARQTCDAKVTGQDPVESTVRYLGIEVDDALAIAEQVDV